MTLPSASATQKTARPEPSGDRPRNAVPTAPRPSAPGKTCVGRRVVRSPAKTPPACGFGAPASGIPVGSRIVDVPIPSSPVGALAGHSRPKALLIERPSGLLTPVKLAVTANGLLTPLKNAGLFALNICTRPPSVDACPPAAAKSEGITSIAAPRGSMDRNEPSCSLGLKAAKDSMDKYVYLRSNPTREHEIERMGETTLIRDMTEVLTSLRRQTLRQTGGET